MLMKNKCAFVLSLLMCSSVNAELSGTSELGKAVDNTDNAIERIEVIGQQPTKYYLDIYRARKEDFLEEFNRLVNDDDMKVKCKQQRQSSSTRIRDRRCRPLFVARIKSEENQKAMALVNYRWDLVTSVNANPAIKQRTDDKMIQLATLMSALIDSNPVLEQKFEQLEQAKLAYEASK